MDHYKYLRIGRIQLLDQQHQEGYSWLCQIPEKQRNGSLENRLHVAREDLKITIRIQVWRQYTRFNTSFRV